MNILANGSVSAFVQPLLDNLERRKGNQWLVLRWCEWKVPSRVFQIASVQHIGEHTLHFISVDL